MARINPIDDEQVHVLHVDEPGAGGGRLPMLLAGIALLVVAGAGVWLWLHPELLEGFTSTSVKTAPAPGEENRLGDSWSFETTESTSASQAWVVPPEAPSGFRFAASGAVSGELGAVAEPGVVAAAAEAPAGAAGSPAAAAHGSAEAENAGWCRIVTEKAVPLGAHRGAVRLSAMSHAPGIELLVRFVGRDGRPLDIVVARGEGPISGEVLVPPGATAVQAGLQCIGPGSADDLSLEFVPAGGLSLQRRGIFDMLAFADGAAVFRGEQGVLAVSGLSAADPSGALPPASLRAASGEPGADLGLTLPDGRVLPRHASLTRDERSVTLSETVDDVPADVTLVRTLIVSGALADAALGIVSARGIEQFAGDFRVEGVSSLVLGHTQDRLALRFEPETTLSAVRQPDGAVVVRAELSGGGRVSQTIVSQTSFQEERVAAAQHRDAALAAEAAGRFGEALGEAGIIVTQFPHDEDVLAAAQALRGRVQLLMQQRLDVIDRGLSDALFLDSASRCREVLADCRAAAVTFAGSDAAALFEERALSVEQRAAKLLEDDRSRRERRLSAIMESFRATGRHAAPAGEIEDTLERFLAPPAADSEAGKTGRGAPPAGTPPAGAPPGDGRLATEGTPDAAEGGR